MPTTLNPTEQEAELFHPWEPERTIVRQRDESGRDDGPSVGLAAAAAGQFRAARSLAHVKVKVNHEA